MRTMSEKSPLQPRDRPVSDAPPENWVDRWAPVMARPYLRLMRADRPIGTWLLLLPCWWGLALAGAMPWTHPKSYLLFALGAFVMRGAGCVLNDIADRKIDAQVARTASRPIPSGQVSVSKAATFMGLLCAIGFLVLLQFNVTAIWLGISSLLIVAVYPFMKRITDWPQLVLGLAFNWGALIGWASVTGHLTLAPVLLYGGAICWTIFYDTIYAHQDKEDDVLIGVKSTALKFGENTGVWLTGFLISAVTLIAMAGLYAGHGPWFAVGVLAFTGHLIWQLRTLDTENAENCLRRFKSNRDAGLLLLAGLVLTAWLSQN